MVIILEGIDRVGKTTLAERIAKEFNCEYFKAERVEDRYCTLKENSAISYGYCMGQVQLFNKTYAEDKEKHIVIDRFHWTEYVYTKIQRDRELDSFYMRNIDAEMLKCKQGYLMILMEPIDLKKCSKMHGRDLSMHRDLFDMIYDTTNLLKYKCTYNSDELAINTIYKFINGKYTRQGE